MDPHVADIQSQKEENLILLLHFFYFGKYTSLEHMKKKQKLLSPNGT